MVETLETSHTWSRLAGAAARRSAPRSATRSPARARPGLVFCHLSHAYPDGASLYFTFVARARAGAEIEQWREVKRAACEAIVAAGGTITHHHAVGRDHAPYMEAEVGELGIEALRAVKERLDPAGIMNPGKLLPLAGLVFGFGFAGFDDRAGDRAAEDGGAAVVGRLSSLRSRLSAPRRSSLSATSETSISSKPLASRPRTCGRDLGSGRRFRPFCRLRRDQRQPLVFGRFDQGDRVGLPAGRRAAGLWR